MSTNDGRSESCDLSVNDQSNKSFSWRKIQALLKSGQEIRDKIDCLYEIRFWAFIAQSILFFSLVVNFLQAINFLPNISTNGICLSPDPVWDSVELLSLLASLGYERKIRKEINSNSLELILKTNLIGKESNSITSDLCDSEKEQVEIQVFRLNNAGILSPEFLIVELMKIIPKIPTPSLKIG
jgi:hypothetical protein